VSMFIQEKIEIYLDDIDRNIYSHLIMKNRR
jgi:hypothetical protein